MKAVGVLPLALLLAFAPRDGAQAQTLPQVPAGSPIQRIAPVPRPSAGGPAIAPGAASISRGNPDDVFEINGATVDGSTVYDAATWAPITDTMRGAVTR